MNEGKKDRRDPIRTIKPRNFVAKNASATTSGAGAHKDKKKAAKQGDVKHKNQEYAESLQHMLESALRDKEDLQAKRKTLQDLSMNKDVDQKAVTQRKLDLEKEAKKKGMAEGVDNNLPSFEQYIFKKLPREFTDLSQVEDLFDYAYLSDLGIFNIADEMEETGAPAKKVATQRVKWVLQNMANKKYLPMIKPLAVEWINLVSTSLSSQQGVAEEFDSPEYNDEAGMARGNLLTLARAVKGLMDTIDDNDNLPEWCQEKIAKSEMMLVTVWDYILSQKEQGIDPSVKEATRTFAPPKTDLKVGDRVVADLRKEKNYPTDQKYVSGFVTRVGEKGVHIDPDGGGEPEWHPYKIVKKLGEGWTHDSLAAQLFETENTYEQQLAGKLARQLKK
jgi:hypothetical protein